MPVVPQVASRCERTPNSVLCEALWTVIAHVQLRAEVGGRFGTHRQNSPLCAVQMQVTWNGYRAHGSERCQLQQMQARIACASRKTPYKHTSNPV